MVSRSGSLDDGGLDIIWDVLNDVPHYSSFKTFKDLEESTDALVREAGSGVKIESIGRTRCGENIRVIVIGSGSLKALLFGAPHPNEPVGTLVLDYLSFKLAFDEDLRKLYDYTWIIVKAVDIDGLKMNEGWFRGPFTISNYVKNYYRPAGSVQIEWSFPIRYKGYVFDKPAPETKALMHVIEKYRPDFIYSLHNAGFGGVYYYISEKAPLLYPALQLYPRAQGVPLNLGEPEVPWARRLSLAIYKMVSLRDYYDFLESIGVNPLKVIRHGGSSFDYAQNHNPGLFEIVTEVPYYYDPRVEDISTSDSMVSRREALLSSIEWQENIYEYIRDIWSQARVILGSRDPCSESGKLMESIDYFAKTSLELLRAKKAWILADAKLGKRATVAEVFDNDYVSKFYTTLSLGMLYRLLSADSTGSNEVRRLGEEVGHKLEEILSYLENNKSYRAIELRKLVQIQLFAGLYSSLYKQYINRTTR